MEPTFCNSSNIGGKPMIIDLLFIAMCSTPGVHPHTTKKVIEIESSLNAFAINVNGPFLNFKQPTDKNTAISTAKALIARGYSVDIGIMQINSANLKPYGLTVEQAFDPCTNIRVGTKILKDNYNRAEISLGSGSDALKAALSAYNTGNFKSGILNGYVGKFYGKRTKPLLDPYRASMVAFDSDEKKEVYETTQNDSKNKTATRNN